MEDNSSTNRIDQSKFAASCSRWRSKKRPPVESGVNNQNLKKEVKITLSFELGYSPKEVADMDPEERIEIYKNQIRKVGEESASPSQSEILEKNLENKNNIA